MYCERVQIVCICRVGEVCGTSYRIERWTVHLELNGRTDVEKRSDFTLANSGIGEVRRKVSW
jgi:hypothetical protein